MIAILCDTFSPAKVSALSSWFLLSYNLHSILQCVLATSELCDISTCISFTWQKKCGAGIIVYFEVMYNLGWYAITSIVTSDK